MQAKINNIFNKICKDKFLKNDDEQIIGKVEDIIKILEKQRDYFNDPKSDISIEERENYNERITEIIYELKNKYSINDVVMLYVHPMDFYYDIANLELTLEELDGY